MGIAPRLRIELDQCLYRYLAKKAVEKGLARRWWTPSGTAPATVAELAQQVPFVSSYDLLGAYGEIIYNILFTNCFFIFTYLSY